VLIARQSTARTVTVGPVLDADGVAVTGGVVGDFKISKDGGAPAALNGSATATHRHTGFYSLALTASDLDTVGTAEITIDDTVNSMALKEISVVEEAVYDALFASGANAFTGAAGSSAITALASGAITEASFATTAGSFIPLGIVDQGVAQSATASTLVLRAAAAFADDELNNCVVYVKGSTQDRWQAGRLITDYVNSTKTASIDPDWETEPTGTINYIVAVGAADLTTPPAVNMTQISGDSTAADNLEAVLDGTGGVTLVADLTGNIDGSVAVASALGSGAVSADAVALDAVQEIRNAITGGAYALSTDANGHIRVVDGTGAGEINTTGGAIASVVTVTGAVGSVTGNVGGNVTGSVGSVASAVTITGDAATAGTRLLTMLELDGSVYRYTINSLEQAPAGGGGGSTDWTSDERTAIRSILGIPASGTTPEDPTAGILDTIRDDTNELQTDWANGGRLDVVLDARASQASVDAVDDFLDTEVAAIKAKTDQLAFTEPGQVDANTKSINDTAVNGTGGTGDKWRGA